MISMTPAFKSFRLQIIKAAHQKYLSTRKAKDSVEESYGLAPPITHRDFESLNLTQEEKDLCGIF